MRELSWLCRRANVDDEISRLEGATAWARAIDIANSRLDFGELLRLDRRIRKLGHPSDEPALSPIKIAILSSCTVEQLLPGIRIASLRRAYIAEIYIAPYGQYAQSALDPASALYAFKPDIVLLSLDGDHLFGTHISPEDLAAQALHRLSAIWRAIKKQLDCQIIQQNIINVAPTLIGNNEIRLAGSPYSAACRFNTQLAALADDEGVDVLDINAQVAVNGIDAWHDPILWLRGKQLVSPKASGHYGELLLRVIAAQRGRSAKCIIVDLDNTLWGGVIGDDGLGGIALGQGSTLGEAFVAFQTYVLNLARRGILIAVCSKNDEINAKLPFDSHPEMVLKLSDISCFIANWNDKAANIRMIARTLNIGLDSLVFIDDNPFERNFVRKELPMVRVPELPDDPALYVRRVSDAGYFEANTLTTEDFTRTKMYENIAASKMNSGSASDLTSYMTSLDMKLSVQSFDSLSLQRVTQLANKTNQFNLTTRRYTEAEIASLAVDPSVIALQFRLEDNFGDHGIVALIIGRLSDKTVDIETWLMSCRVLGRNVEGVCLHAFRQRCRSRGGTLLIGNYFPTAKNGMVSDLYIRLGFRPVMAPGSGEAVWHQSLNIENDVSSQIIKILDLDL